MAYTRIKNIYQSLDIDELGEVSTTQIGRKAIKKLREIEKLKTKSNPTSEEREKISTEKYWMNILHPPEVKPSVRDLKKQAEKEKRQKRIEDKYNEKALRAEQEIREHLARQKAEEQARQKAEEDTRRLNKLRREQEALEKLLTPFHKNPLAIVIYNEYMTISREKSNKISFHQLSMKYHPDKNHTENTTLHQQILHHIHEKMAKK
jgi:hypothetical protein